MRTAVKLGNWKTVQLPEDLIKSIDDLISAKGMGYTSRAEFIKEAVRLRIQQVKKEET